LRSLPKEHRKSRKTTKAGAAATPDLRFHARKRYAAHFQTPPAIIA
jgi:hypothetical protein